MKKENSKAKLGILLGILVGAFLLYYFTGLRNVSPTDLAEFIQGFGWLGGLIFIGIYVIATVFALPGSILTLAAGAIFGPLLGFVYVLFAANIGCNITFFVGRYFGGFVAKKLDNMKALNIKKANQKISENGLLFVMSLRLIPVFPFNVLNYGLPLTKLKYRDYFLGTLLGMIPGTFAFVYLGGNIFNPSSPQFWIALGVFVGLIVVTALVKKYKGSKLM